MNNGKGLLHAIANFGKIWLDPNIFKKIRGNILLILIQSALIAFFYGRLPTQIPIFFSNPWGEAQLGSALSLFLLPLFSLIVLLINTLICASLITRHSFLAQSLATGSLIFAFFSLIAIIKILLLVF